MSSREFPSDHVGAPSGTGGLMETWTVSMFMGSENSTSSPLLSATFVDPLAGALRVMLGSTVSSDFPASGCVIGGVPESGVLGSISGTLMHAERNPMRTRGM